MALAQVDVAVESDVDVEELLKSEPLTHCDVFSHKLEQTLFTLGGREESCQHIAMIHNRKSYSRQKRRYIYVYIDKHSVTRVFYKRVRNRNPIIIVGKSISV